MNLQLAQVTETLAGEFRQLPATTVVRVVTDCAAEFPDQPASFIEPTARARLEELAADSAR